MEEEIDTLIPSILFIKDNPDKTFALFHPFSK